MSEKPFDRLVTEKRDVVVALPRAEAEQLMRDWWRYYARELDFDERRLLRRDWSIAMQKSNEAKFWFMYNHSSELLTEGGFFTFLHKHLPASRK